MNNLASKSESTIQRTRFMLIDDIVPRRELLERYLLLSSALHVRHTSSPLAALRVMQDPRTPVDCVICAHEFQPLSGLEFLQNLRGGRYGGRLLSETKFILMLKRRDDSVLQAAKALRVNGHIVGAFDRDSLTELVSQLLHANDASAAAETASDELLLSESSGPRIKVAHLRVQGIDLVIVPVDSGYGAKSPEELQAEIAMLRASATQANLHGEVVPVWANGEAGMAFIAPINFHPYFRSINLDFVAANLNRDIYLEHSAAPVASSLGVH